jgi:uncharacterized membrane protein
MKKIIFFYNKLMATFWFVPALIIILSIFVSIGLLTLDQLTTFSQDGLGKYFFVTSTNSARSILSTISGAMIGVAGTVFSVTLVALTLASSQFGSRLIKNFMYVRLNQVVLGSYVATYLYCLFVLTAIRENDAYTFMPVLSILFAIIAALLNIILLIVFIHTIATSIQADNIISDISDLISEQTGSLYPMKIGSPSTNQNKTTDTTLQSKYFLTISILASNSGYLQYVDGEQLLEKMQLYDALIVLNVRPGNHLVKGISIASLYSNTKLDEEQIKGINEQFVIGKTKVNNQDLAYSIDQMVEIASRALSSGVNDPYTAITCIDYLTSTLCLLSEIEFASNYRMDAENQVRIITTSTDFEGFMDVSFNQIRQFSAGSSAVILRLMDSLITLFNYTPNESYKKTILKHAKMVLNVGKQSLKEELDYKDLEERSRKILLASH